MKQLYFSEGAIYRLRRLSQVVNEETGVRHRLSDPASVMKLLRFSATSPISRVIDNFFDLLSELSEDQKSYIREKGILVPSATGKKPRITKPYSFGLKPKLAS